MEEASQEEKEQLLLELLKDSDVVQLCNNWLFDQLVAEVTTLCSKTTNSTLRHTDESSLLTFNFEHVYEEWKTQAPMFVRFIDTVTSNPRNERNVAKKGEGILASKISAGAKLLSIFNQNMSLLQRITSLIFLKGGLKKSSFNRMSSVNECQSYLSTIKLADSIAENWNREIQIWQSKVSYSHEVEQQILTQIHYISDTISLLMSDTCTDLDSLYLEKASLEKELYEHRKGMHPGYYFVGDNVDMVTKVRTITQTNQHKDQHMFQICAYKNRVSGNDLDDTKPKKIANSVNFSDVLPGAVDKTELISNFAFLVARIWAENLSAFTAFQAVLPECIEHQHMKETKQKTERVCSNYVIF